MIRETRELLAALSQLNQLVPGVVLGILDGSLSPAKQVEFGDLLVAAGKAVQEQARTATAHVVEGGDVAELAQP